jgi:hypothetical protein
VGLDGCACSFGLSSVWAWCFPVPLL